MQVDFYHLTRDLAPAVLPAIASRVIDGGGRLLVVAEQDGLRKEISRNLWENQSASYLAHDEADAALPEAQPILLSGTCEPLNGARFIALADGLWRAEAMAFERIFLFFNEGGIDGARVAWRELGEREGVDRRYWKQDGGRWKQGP